MHLDLFSIIIIVFVVLVGGYAAYIQIKTKKNGIEAEAVVTDVTESWERNGDSDSLCYSYTVEYKNSEGKTVTAALGSMSNMKKDLDVGDRIVVKYLKDRQDYPVLVKKL